MHSHTRSFGLPPHPAFRGQTRSTLYLLRQIFAPLLRSLKLPRLRKVSKP